jgi:transcriptional regulator with XRE-family HTH domain
MEEKRRRKEEARCRNKGTFLPHLRAIRTSRHLSQERLSKRSDVSRETVYRLEGDKRGELPDTVWKFARSLGVSPQELVHGRRHTWWWG